MVRTNHSSAIIERHLMRFCHLINADEVFGTHRSLAFVLIAGVFGQIAATRRVSSITHQITAFLNDKAETAKKAAADANKLAGEAHERAEALENENIKLKAYIRGLILRTGDRQMNAAERTLLKDSLKGEKYSVTIVMIDDREARQYAVDIARALKGAGARVQFEDAKTSKYLGVLVCDDSKFTTALQSAKIEAHPVNQKTKDRPDFCDRVAGSPPPAVGFLAIFELASPDFSKSQERGTVVFVGQKDPRKMPR